MRSTTAARWSQKSLLLSVLRDPALLGELDLPQWDLLLRIARQAGVASRLALEVESRGLWEQIPPAVRPHIASAAVLATRHERVVRWEINRLEHALRDLPGPLVLLKGAAYLAAGLPISKGRLYSDVDLLVPREQLPQVESTLLAQDWIIGEIDERDERYFREWLHELPPLRHRRRRTTLDVHHTILPRTDRLRVDPARLLEASISVPGTRLRVLAPADMFLHSAAHLFRNGDFSHALRDLADLDGLARHFGADPEFWTRLGQRAEDLDLRLPCCCALRYTVRYFHTPVDVNLAKSLKSARPRWPLRPFVDRWVDRALMPLDIDQPDRGRQLALALLAHWPLPRWESMLTGVFWTKRLPRWKNRGAVGPTGAAIQPGGELERRG